MNKIITMTVSGSDHHSEIFEECGEFEVFNMINAEQVSRGFPVRTYKTKNGAVKYAKSFMNNDNIIVEVHQQEEPSPQTQNICDEEHEIIEPEMLKAGDKVWLRHKTEEFNYYGGLITAVTSHEKNNMVISIHDEKKGSGQVYLKNYNASYIREQTSISYVASFASGCFSSHSFDTLAEAEAYIQDVYDNHGGDEYREYWQQRALQMIITKEIKIIDEVITPSIKK